jgi:hypothetical protein
MQRAATLASCRPVAFDTKGTVREARGFTSKHVDRAVLDGELHVHETDDVERLRHLLGLVAQLVLGFLRQRVGRQRARRIAGMHAGLLDVLHDAADDHLLPSDSASTSTSVASLRKRSSSTGESLETLMASRM